MDPNILEVDKNYTTTTPIKACYYDNEDCLVADGIDLLTGTELTYIGPDAEDGNVFKNAEGTRFCLHLDDLASLEEV